MAQYWSEIVSFLAGAGSSWAVRSIINYRRKSDESKNTVDQRASKVGGHQAGRDIKLK